MTEHKGTLQAVLSYVTAPSPQQLEGIRAFLQKKYACQQVELTLREDKSLVSGFTLQAGADEYDWSAQGRVEQFRERLKSVRAVGSLEDIIPLLKAEVTDFDLEAKNQEVGVVRYVGDGIATIDGIDHAMYGEIIQFDSGDKGMVQDIRRNEIGCILFSNGADIHQGSRVMRTGRMAGIPVGDAFLGRVVDALGSPIDGGGPIDAAGYRPIESPAPVSWTGAASAFPWRRVSWPSTPCSPLAGASGS